MGKEVGGVSLQLKGQVWGYGIKNHMYMAPLLLWGKAAGKLQPGSGGQPGTQGCSPDPWKRTNIPTFPWDQG